MLDKDPMIPIAEVYSKALDLFKDPSRHAKYNYCYNEKGEMCPWAEGYSFCAIGALIYFSEGYSFRATCCLQRVSEYFYGDSIQEINDRDGSYSQVVQALQAAKELWEGYEPTDEDLRMSIPDLLKKRNVLP